MKNPAIFDTCVEEVLQVFLQTARFLVCEWLEECNTLLECSAKRRNCWHVKDHGKKSILTSIGSITFTRIRFTNKETNETAYLLDKILGWERIPALVMKQRHVSWKLRLRPAMKKLEKMYVLEKTG